MKNPNMPSTNIIIKKKHNKQNLEDKEKYNALNKNNSNNSNNLRDSKNHNKMNNYPIKHGKYNSTIGLNDLKLNLDINKDNNIDNNISPKNQSKELINSISINNFEDLDEKLDIKFPYSINNNITNSLIATQGPKNPSFNIRSKMINNKVKGKKLNVMPVKLNEKRNNNNSNEDLKENIFNTYNKNLINKTNTFLQNFNDKNKYAQNKKKENKTNINIITNIINKKKYRSIEENDSEKDSTINNGIYNNNNLFKNFYNQSYNATFENEHINRNNNNIFYQKPSGYYMKKIQNNNNKEFINFSNNNNGKRYYSMNKKDLNYQLKRNHNYIQKIIDQLPKKNPMIHNFDYDYRKNIKNTFYNNLDNKDNNVENNNFNNKLLFNNFVKSETDNHKTINTNSVNIFLKNNINSINNIKSVRVSRYLSVEKQKNFNKSNESNKIIYEKKIVEDKNTINNHNHTYYNGFYNYKSKTKKSSSIKSAFISIKLKNFTEFIFNVYNRKFKHLLINFLDNKSILRLSSTSTDFFRNTRNFFYLYFYNNLIIDKNNNKFINKILHSTKNFCSEKIKNKIKKGEFKSFYEKLSNKKNELYEELITKDIPRTIPGDISFSKGKNNYNKLYRILTCFSNYNKKIGYAQGINFIIANAIYLFNSEEEVFIFFEGFINLLKMDNFFGLGNDKKMIYKLSEFNNILIKYIPDIIKFFNDKQVSHDFFTTKWILTLFSTSLERNYLAIIWCFMIIFKWKFVYSYIIQILKKYKNNIFSSTDNQLCHKMKNILNNKDFKNDFNEIIQNTMNFMKNNIVL